jgi:hypothetical protein
MQRLPCKGRCVGRSSRRGIFENENDLPPPDTADKPLQPPAPSVDVPPVPDEPQIPDAPVPVPQARPQRVHKASQRTFDLLEGKGSTSARSADPQIPQGVRLPVPVPEERELEGEGEDELNAIFDDDFLMEYALATEMSRAEALEPRTLAEAKRGPDWPRWEEAIQEELATLKAAGTWDLVDKPRDANVVGSKWVFSLKKDADGNIVHYKAHLVAQGFSQVPRVNYFDTFAPVAKLASVRAVLAMAAALDLELHQGRVSKWGTHRCQNRVYAPGARVCRPRYSKQSLPPLENAIRAQAKWPSLVSETCEDSGKQPRVHAV